MIVEFKTVENIATIRRAGRVVADCHQAIARRIAPGVTTLEIDRFVERFMRERGAYPAQKGYKGYPFAICASANDVVCHGFPDSVPLTEGDIVTIDMVADVDGWKADSAWTYAIGRPTPGASRLLRTARLALSRGIAEALPGKRIGDIGWAIQSCAERASYRVVDEFTGHGIGRSIHEPPQVDHQGQPGYGPILEAGMVITVEPILTEGRPDIHIERDGWTARTNDGSRAAQFEHTIAITDHGPVILTR